MFSKVSRAFLGGIQGEGFSSVHGSKTGLPFDFSFGFSRFLFADAKLPPMQGNV
jgi:hypothetical protein